MSREISDTDLIYFPSIDFDDNILRPMTTKYFL